MTADVENCILIERESWSVLEDYIAMSGWDGTPPVPVDLVLEYGLNVTITQGDIGKLFGMDDAVAAALNGKIVVIDYSLDPTKDFKTLILYQFTMAHETGHIVLHPAKGSVDFSGGDGSESSDAVMLKEKEADRFAYYLMLPEAYVRSAWAKYEEGCRNGEIPEEIVGMGLGNGEDGAGRPDCGSRAARDLGNLFLVPEKVMLKRLRELGLINPAEGHPSSI